MINDQHKNALCFENNECRIAMKELEKRICNAVHDYLTNWNESLTPIISNIEIDDMVEHVKK